MLEAVQQRERDQGRREAAAHLSQPREAESCPGDRQPGQRHRPAAVACPNRRPASDQRSRRGRRGRRIARRMGGEGKAHAQRRAARRRRRTRSCAQTSWHHRFAAARAAGCLWWPWRCYAPPSPLCSGLKNSCWTQIYRPPRRLHATARRSPRVYNTHIWYFRAGKYLELNLFPINLHTVRRFGGLHIFIF